MEEALSPLPSVRILFHEPTAEYRNVAKPTGVTKLTPARSPVAETVRRYWIPGLECTHLEVQKPGGFRERTFRRMGIPDPLDPRFIADKYGLYAGRLRHLRNGLDGSYLPCDKRLSDVFRMRLAKTRWSRTASPRTSGKSGGTSTSAERGV
jgi:hypothetical protein